MNKQLNVSQLGLLLLLAFMMCVGILVVGRNGVFGDAEVAGALLAKAFFLLFPKYIILVLVYSRHKDHKAAALTLIGSMVMWLLLDLLYWGFFAPTARSDYLGGSNEGEDLLLVPILGFVVPPLQYIATVKIIKHTGTTARR